MAVADKLKPLCTDFPGDLKLRDLECYVENSSISPTRRGQISARQDVEEGTKVLLTRFYQLTLELTQEERRQFMWSIRAATRGFMRSKIEATVDDIRGASWKELDDFSGMSPEKAAFLKEVFGEGENMSSRR